MSNDKYLIVYALIKSRKRFWTIDEVCHLRVAASRAND